MRKRIGEVDVLRAVAAVAVVMIHVTALPLVTLPITSRSFFLNSLINQWSRFSIPAFVLITGMVLFYSYGRRTEFNTREFFSRRLQAIAVPYLIWSVFYMLYRAPIEGNWGELLPNTARALVQGTAMYQLYFVVLIFQYYLLFPLIRPLSRSRWIGVAVAAALTIQLLLMWDTYYGLFTQQITAPWAKELLRWRDRLFPWWSGYFMLGVWFGGRLDQVLTFTRRYRWPLLVGAAGLLGLMMVEYVETISQPGMSASFAATGFRPTAYLYALVAVAAILGLGSWMIDRWERLSRVLLELGKHSFGIFLVHPLILDLTMRLLAPVSLTPSLYLLLVTLLVIPTSYLFSRLLSILPFGHWIVGRT